MKYLFFDIETIMAEKINPRIVSFGYVLTDEAFNEISKDDIFINPQEETTSINNWKWKQDATKDQEGFKAFYHKIKDLLQDKDTIVVGHGTDFDVKYLSDECDRFHFEPLDFDYLDTKKLADLLLDTDIPKKLQNLYAYLCGNRSHYRWHRSLDDACMTRDVFEALLDIANQKNINILENEKLVFNSLRCVYGKRTNVAKKDDNFFSCNFDIPIIGMKIEYSYVNDTEHHKEKIHLYYDYATDLFFTPKHPRKGNVKENSLLPESSYEVAQKRAVYKINKMWNDAINGNRSNNFFYREGYQLSEMHMHIFHTLTSYEVYAAFKNNFLEFDCKIALSDSYLKNAIPPKKNMIINLKRIIQRIHTAETANKSMRLMAKMKFGYKDKHFPEIHIEELPYNENVKYLLAKEYVNLLTNPGTQKGSNDILINNNKAYIPIENSFENNLFSERLLLPALAETIR